jgi:hypothetical protein
MKAIFGFFIDYAPLIYVLLAVGLALGLRRLMLARVEAREAIYGLEREIAHRHTSRAVTTLSIVGLLAVGEFIMLVFLQPNMPAIFQLATPTTNILFAQTGAIGPSAGVGTDAFTPGATPVSAESGCIPDHINIRLPKAGDEVRGEVVLTGDANVPNFGFYKYEYAPAGTDNWLAIQAKRDSVQNGELGTWDTTIITQGDYLLRLVVSDNQGNQFPPCVIPLRIKAP